MYDTHMSTPGNTAKLGTAQSNSIPGWDRTHNALVRILLSQRINPLCYPHVIVGHEQDKYSKAFE